MLVLPMFKKKSIPAFQLFICLVALWISSSSSSEDWASGPVVKKGERRSLVLSEYGEISAVRITDGIEGSYLLHFFKLEPDSLFLPAILNADIIFYVHSGSGRLSWAEEDEVKHIDLRRGDVYRLPRGSVFFIRCRSGSQHRLRLHAIFPNSDDDLREPVTAPYSSIQGMVLGFNKRLLQATFKVSEGVIEELLDGTKPWAIVRVDTAWEMEAQFTRNLLESRSYNIFELNKKKKKSKERATLVNLFEEDKDLENCNGWITTITRKKLSALKGSNIGLFMVNLTIGSMMGPHWNSMDSEVAVVVEGRGMVRVVCSSISKETGCRDMRFEVEEGDVFAVPRFHGMAQMAFNNETFAFMGFSTMKQRKAAGFLAGESSVLRILDREVLAMTFNVSNSTVGELLAPRDNSVISACTSCAEEEQRLMEEEEEEPGEPEREQEEEEAESGRGEEGGQGQWRGTKLEHQNYDHHKWGTQFAENMRRLTI